MTIQELHNALTKAIDDGFGSESVFFDTEARCFNYCLAEVTRASVSEDGPDGPYLNLTDGLPHYDGRVRCSQCAELIYVEDTKALCGECFT